MKKSFKKSIAVLLSVLMAICVMPFSAFAVDDVKPNIALQFNTFSYATTGKTFQNYATPRNMSEAFWKTFGLYAAPLDYKNGALTLKADKANATSTAKGFGATTATSDYTYKTGDYFTVTVRLDNVSKIAATEVAIKYSNNIAPAGIGQTNNAYRFYSLSDTNTASSGANAERARAGYPIPAQSASSLYAGLNDGLIGDASYIDADEKVIYTMVSNQDGNNSTSVASVSETDFTNDNGTSGNNYANKAILATYAFKIIGSGDITFELANPTDVDSCYYLAEEEAGVVPSPEKYQTFAETENEGSAGVTFMGTSADGTSATKYTVVFKNADGTVISSTDYAENADVDVPALPTKASDATNHYTYAWDKTPATTATADAEYTAVETATAHTFDAGVVTKEPTTTETGIKTYTCSACKFTKTETIEKVVAHTHSYTWVYNEDAWRGTDKVEHDGTETGTCECGDTQTRTATGTGSLRVTTYNLTLSSGIAVNYKLKQTTVNQFDRVWCKVQKLNNATGQYEEDIVEEGKIDGSNFTFVYTKIAPQAMADNMIVTMCAERDGIVYEGTIPFEIDVRSYAMTQLNKQTSKTSTAVLFVDMLNYGAAAQDFMKYNQSDYINSQLSATQASWATPLIANSDYVDSQNSSYVVCANPTAKWRTAALVLESSVDFKMSFSDPNNGTTLTDISNLQVKVELENGLVQWYNPIDNEECFTPYGTQGRWNFQTKDIAVSNLVNPIYLTICDKDGNPVSNTFKYSAESFTRRQDGKAIKPLLDHMQVYAKACADYIVKGGK